MNRKNTKIEIRGCPRLTGWNALEKVDLSQLNLVGVYMLPDFSKVHTKGLRLESIDWLEDLNCLEDLDAEQQYNRIELLDLPGITDISPVRRLQGGLLKVQPEVMELAQSIVEEGRFRECEVGYPESGWEPWNAEVKLKNLEELDQLPIAALRHVDNLCLAGDQVVDWEQDELREEWQNDKRKFILYNRETGEESNVKTGTLTDLNRLAKLTGLKSLEIDDQPLTSLEGIQGMLELEEISLKSCYQLNDISQLFTLENIRKIGLFSVPVSSIQGIQNLTKLQELKLHNTEVTDISPLAECDLTEANRNGGLWLEILGSRVDTAPLESIKQFAYKQVEGQELDYSPIVNTEPEETEVPENQGILPKLEDLVGMN